MVYNILVLDVYVNKVCLYIHILLTIC